MSDPHDPSNPHGGSGGHPDWAATLVQAPAFETPPQAQPGAEATQGGWISSAQVAPQGAQGGWSAPPQGQPNAAASQVGAHGGSSTPQPGQPSAPSPQGGWSPPAQAAPQGAHGGWSAPPEGQPSAPVPHGGWSPPAPPQSPAQPGGWAPPSGARDPSPTTGAPANANAPAQWAERSPNVRGPVDFFFKPPKDLSEPKRGLYTLLTVASAPVLVGAFLAFYMFKARIRRGGVTPFLAIYSHFLGSAFFASAVYWIGEAIGIGGYVLIVPVLVLVWIPLAARYVLAKLASS